MKCLILGFMLLISFSTMSAMAAEPEAFDQSLYSKLCGGRFYPLCDDAKLNQEIIYNEALKLANSTNRKLVAIFGFDECPACVQLQLMFMGDLNTKAELNKKYVFVKINSRKKSADKLIANLGVKIIATPAGVVQDSQGKNQVFLLHVEQNLKSLQARMTDVINGTNNQYVWFPTADLGSEATQDRVRISMLKKPIVLDMSILPLVNQEIKTSSLNEKANHFYLQGLFHLFTFNWIDSTRSFKMALDLDSNFVEAYMGLAEALSKLSAKDESIASLVKAYQLSKTLTVSKSTQNTLKFQTLLRCLRTFHICDKFEIAYINAEKTKELVVQASDLANRANADEKNYDLMALINNDFMQSEISHFILKALPKHIGAHHHLVHAYEGKNDYKTAVIHAEELARLAPNSAHAQHMYGHILPKVGKWNEAIAQFEKADQIHKKWITENGSNAEEDWHYRHNLDLLSHAYNWNKNYDKAEKGWTLLCDYFGGGYCRSLTSFLISIGKLDEAEKILSERKEDRLSYFLVKYLKVPGDKKNRDNLRAVLEEDLNSFHAQALGFMLIHQEKKLNTKQFEDAIAKSLSEAGFDSWSVSILNTQVYAYMAEKMGNKALAANLRLIAASVGFVCKGSK